MMFLSLAAVFMLFFPAASEASATQARVAEIQRAYAALQAFSGTFTQELRHAESGAVERREGTLFFEKPLRVRWETKDPYPELLVVNDAEVWDYLPDESIAYRHSLDVIKDSRSMLQVITGQSRLDQDFTIEREADRNGFITLRLFPKEPSAQMVETLLLVDPRTSLLKSAEVIDFYGNVNKFEFIKITPNPTIPADAFRFAPPEGVTVENGATEGELRR